jgi:hypothetical protein
MNPMKFLVLIPIFAAAFIASSCRTITPLDANTMKQSCKTLPGHFKQDDSSCYHNGRSSK